MTVWNARTGTAGIALGSVLVGAVVVSAVAIALHHRRTVRTPGELAPDAAALHYRYAIAPAADAGDEIAALEARVASAASPFDDAALADLYFRRGQQIGDPDDYQRAEARAQR